MQTTISIIIHTHNENKNIVECISSAHLLSDNVVLIDMESGDNTVAIAKEKGVIVYSYPYTSYVEPAREYGISKGESSWIFLLDADERMTQELAEEIKLVIASNEFSYYKVPRKEILFRKKWLKHGGWWPNYQIRLINKDNFVSWPKAIHSTPVIKGTGGFIKNPLLHYSQNDFSDIINKTIIFEDQESNLLYEANRPVSTVTFFRKFTGEFYRRMVKAVGFLDGEIGIIESIYQAFSKTITYLYLYEKKNRRPL